MTVQPVPSESTAVKLSRLRHRRRLNLYWAGGIAFVLGCAGAFSPMIWPDQAFLPAAASLFAAILIAFSALAVAAGLFGRYSLASAAKKDRRASSAAASVQLWLLTFGVISGVLFAWRLLEVVAPVLPGMLASDARVQIVREQADRRMVMTVGDAERGT